MPPLTPAHVDAINTISAFLANSQIPSLHSHTTPVSVIVLCGNSILPLATHVFTALQANPTLTTHLVICGGIGHSTPHLYDAVSSHPIYHTLSANITTTNPPEAELLHAIQRTFHPLPPFHPQIHIEPHSTNCGANALETRHLLDATNIPTPTSLLIVQDPTMSLRTLASFQHAYSDHHHHHHTSSPPPTFQTCPVIVPRMKLLLPPTTDKSSAVSSNSDDSTTPLSLLAWDHPPSESALLWPIPRFLDLLMGEIPRLRDDAEGYGPKGKGFIAHVDVSREVEEAFELLRGVLGNRR